MYVLRLQHGCFYVGRTDNFEERLRAHNASKGSNWTHRHSPTSYNAVDHFYRTAAYPWFSNFYENDLTLEVYNFLREQGLPFLHLVRGGDYSQVQLPPERVRNIW